MNACDCIFQWLRFKLTLSSCVSVKEYNLLHVIKAFREGFCSSLINILFVEVTVKGVAG